MTEYKSSLFVLGKNLVYAVGGALVAMLVLHWFVSGAVAVGAGILVAAALIYFTLYKDNIRVTVDDTTMTVWRFGTQLHAFTIDECGFKANITTTRDGIVGDSDCALVVTDGEGNETDIDCSMLGARRFYQLLDALGILDPEPARLETTR